MKILPLHFLVVAAALVGSGCASDGGSHDNNSGDYIGPVYPASGMYYGSHDYYYHDEYPDYIVTPRPPVDNPDTPDNRPGLRPEHPIANPPGTRPERPSTLPAERASSRTRPTSMSQQRARTASIPSRSRPMGSGRRGGGGRRR
jgi:hypothetical protein